MKNKRNFNATITVGLACAELAKGSARRNRRRGLCQLWPVFEDDRTSCRADPVRSCGRVTNLYPKSTARKWRLAVVLFGRREGLTRQILRVGHAGSSWHLGKSIGDKSIRFSPCAPMRAQATSGGRHDDTENAPACARSARSKKDSPGHGPKFRFGACPPRA